MAFNYYHECENVFVHPAISVENTWPSELLIHFFHRVPCSTHRVSVQLQHYMHMQAVRDTRVMISFTGGRIPYYKPVFLTP